MAMRRLPWPVSVILVLCAACSAKASDRSGAQSPAESVSTPTTTASSTHVVGATLGCRQELGAGISASHPDTWILGLTSDGWHGQRTALPAIRVSDGQRRWYFYKTYTYVTKTAAPHTTLRLLAPKTARLAYVEGDVWTSGHLTDRTILKAATQSVTLANCASNRSGYAGGILFQSPTCVRIQISADRDGTTRHREIQIPFDASCKP